MFRTKAAMRLRFTARPFWIGLIPLSIAAAAGATSDYTFEEVSFLFCYNGNVCRFTIPDVHPLLGQAVNVRIRGIETPRLEGPCDAEKTGGERVKEYLNNLLARAERIDLVTASRGTYFRIVADVKADGMDVGEHLISRGMARPYNEDGVRSNWCVSDRVAGQPPLRPGGTGHSGTRCTEPAPPMPADEPELRPVQGLRTIAGGGACRGR
ncbi:MAG: thermonuclease family protein [SAR324 cluster bacterium]|nr:thermonuclease family protein [SAR324 cluster bacterium]